MTFSINSSENALIGASGFIGSHFLEQGVFNHLFNSKNSAEMRGEDFDFLVCCGARGTKWKANLNPEEDTRHIDELIDNLSQVKSHKAVLISSIDVYSFPQNVNENDEPRFENHTYGKNRRRLELFFQRHFQNSIVIRLPTVFGPDLNKNVIYDLLTKHELYKIDGRNKYQLYNLKNLFQDTLKVVDLKIPLIHFATEPIVISEVANAVFDISLQQNLDVNPTETSMKTIHAQKLNRNGGFTAVGAENYLYSKEDILKDLKDFVKSSNS